MKNWNMPRRTFLRGAAGAILGLPLLEVMDPRSARAAAKTVAPIRLGCIYMPNGIPLDAWEPETINGKISKMNEWMSSFQSLSEKVQFLQGLQSETEGSHPGASATWLIRPLPEGDSVMRSKNVGSPSMDQLVARAIGDQTPFSSLELITKPEGSHSKDALRNNISWRNATTPVPRQSQPRAVYDRLTGQAGEGESGDGSRRQSILDAVLDDTRSLRNRVSTADQHKIDEYFDAVRSVEKRMSDMASESRISGRAKAATVPRPAEERPEDHAEYLRLMFDMIVLAYWTDSTRVATFMLDHEQTNRYFNFIPGVKGMWHAISHWRDVSGKTEDDDGETSWSSREVKYDQYRTIIKYHHDQVAYFFNRLNEIQEGEGTLLDNSMILYGAPFEDGNEHISADLPVMIAGRAGGKISSGRVLDHSGAPAEGVYLSMMDMMGVPIYELGGIDTVVPIT